MSIVQRRAENGKMYFKDTETEKDYRRIVAGLGWPYAGMKPGFLVVVAEDREPDYSLPGSPRHFRVLDELESEILEELHRTCTLFKNKYLLQSIYSDTRSAHMGEWAKLNKQNEERNIKAVSLALAPNLDRHDYMDFYMGTVKKPLSVQKTLQFGDASNLRNSFGSLPKAEELVKQQLAEFPALAALGYAVIPLTIHEPAKNFPPPPPPRHSVGVAGY